MLCNAALYYGQDKYTQGYKRWIDLWLRNNLVYKVPTILRTRSHTLSIFLKPLTYPRTPTKLSLLNELLRYTIFEPYMLTIHTSNGAFELVLLL